MLSYRHEFHAGNHADVIKHITVSLLMDYLKKKDKPFCYLDTHAGAGLYDFASERANQVGEYQQGIARLWAERAQWPQLASYFSCIEQLNPDGNLRYYPGSPELVRQQAREQDRLVLMELHNTEFDVLRQNMRRDTRITLHHRDGFEGIVALTPPTPRRGLALIDPSYEQKSDYLAVVKSLEKAFKRWPIGIVAVWYPLLGREADYSHLLIEYCQRLHVPFMDVAMSTRPQSETWGMHGSGMLIFNPPWQFDETMTAIMPQLTPLLAEDTRAAQWTLHRYGMTGE
jgi:23S rRNA (adenine2030-N6)-methyltransferase